MTAKQWKTKIKKQLSALDQKQEGYRPVIDTLADILEQRDNVYIRYCEEGSSPVCAYTKAWMRELGLVMNISELGATEEMLEGLADATLIMNGGYKVLSRDEIVQILKESM